MSKRNGKILAALLAVTLLMTACAGGGTASPSEPGSAGDGGAASGAEPITISYFHTNNSDVSEGKLKMLELKLEEFKKVAPHITVESRPSKPGTDYREQYDKLLMTNDAPTINDSLPHVDIQTRINNGTIGEFTKYYEDFDLRKEGKILDIFDEAISKDGKWYAIPIRSYVIAHVYNRETIKAGGGDPENLPNDWQSFAEYCQAVTDKNAPRFGYIFIGSDYLAWNFTPWVWAAGGEMVRPNSDGTFSIAFNEEPGVDAAMFWNELVFKYNATQTDVLKSWNDLQTDIQAGYGAMGWGDAARFAALAEEKFGLTPERFGTAPIPGKTADMEPVSFAGGSVWVCSPTATEAELDAAWEFIKYVTFDEEYLRKEWQLEGEYNVDSMPNFPARTDLTDVKYSFAQWPEGWQEEYAAASACARPEPWCANWNDLKNALVIPMQKVIMTENITREEVQKLLDDCAAELYQNYPDSFRPAN